MVPELRQSIATEPAQLPTLPGFIDGWVGKGASGWAVQCRECGRIGRGRRAGLAVMDGGIRFHKWPDGSNPRLCRECRQLRACNCLSCADERRGARQ